MAKIKTIKSGIQTTVQDTGRWGYQQYGMPVSGAMDTYSLQLANKLVGNNLNEACLEATINGPTIQFEEDIYISLCGANMQAKINNAEVEMYKTLAVKTGDILSFGELINGSRTYIAFSGGIKVPVIMGSKSTYLRGNIGGLNGRQLKAGDELEIGNSSDEPEIKKATSSQIPDYKDSFTARIIAGPESGYFTLNGLEKFLYSEFELSDQCDRMGYRLSGAKIEHKSTAEIISSGITFGSVQVPMHGESIIMMADRQTTGGYPRIANVISADLSYIAQLKPGDKIRFEEVKLDVAYKILKVQRNLLNQD
ncbi:MAG: biotin-dependent carboxyltransferase family protein [Bacteroidales bacterium]|nr:biotin-dependent carboxyltransferase family protein [Bacteroidales bacterium]